MAQLTPLAATDAARLLADYGLSLAEWRPLDAGSVNSNFTFTAMYEPPKLAPLDPVIRQGRERIDRKSVV